MTQDRSSSHNSIAATPSDGRSVAGAALVVGLATAAAMWVLWLVLHFPGVGLEPKVTGPILVAAQAAASLLAAWRLRAFLGRGELAKAMLLAGVLTAAINLACLGSLISPQAPATGGPESPTEPNHPHLALMAAGYLGLSLAIALIAGLGAAAAGSAQRRAAPNWNALLAKVTAAGVFPALLVGGLVTSEGAGLAVPDWPGTWGGNIFLYPISLMAADPLVHAEHSHRLLAYFAGVCVLVLGIYTLCVERRGFVKAWTLAVMLSVPLQAVIGGIRVMQHTQLGALVHGVLAQALFAALVALAAYLSMAYSEPLPAADEKDRRRRVLSTALVHTLILQLAMGAVYRHFGTPHALYTHLGLALVVMALATLVGALCTARPVEAGSGVSRTIRRGGKVLVVLAGIQFLLGGGAFVAAPPGSFKKPQTAEQLQERDDKAEPHVPVWKAVVRTAHQGNGALVIAAAAVLAVHCRRLSPKK